MAKKPTSSRPTTTALAPADPLGDPLAAREAKDRRAAGEQYVHVYGKGGRIRCKTEPRGFATPRNRDRKRLVVEATDGFVPLWDVGVTLKWRFARGTLSYFRDPVAAGERITDMLAAAMLLWGDAAPVRLSRTDGAADFEVVMERHDDCEDGACVLASAFFPDSGKHALSLYPQLFRQSNAEQIETLVHELGHVFGLRHFFAKIEEARWRSEIFGAHVPFTIMNYGDESALTKVDKSDLKRLYKMAHSGELSDINGTPIQLVRPFLSLHPAAEPMRRAASRRRES